MSMTDWQEKLSQIFNSKVKLYEEEVSALLNKWHRSVQLKRNDFLFFFYKPKVNCIRKP